MLTYVKMMENYLEDHKQFTCQGRRFKITAERISRNGKNFNLYTFEGEL